MLVAALLAFAIPADPGQAEILAFADAFDRAQLAQDAKALETMVDDDLVYVDGTGKRQGKKAFIALWTTPGDRFEPVVLIDRRVVLLGNDAAVVNAETMLSGSSNGERFSARIRYADTFRRIGGKWRAVHIQVTPIR
ncbi:ketosteroid isomerase-like protein [Sphingomonas naasensis]|nr:nuclear transport factor 2 family protein [Sphingomonas naasensis]NIJ21539.1 ketosteroid isomerase-like protein [Sphingomonas naasensis]